ncbi:uncharacterized protein PAC_08670 [Phialocephala subalpina]|uniref:Uncharacterized protein n=1 Tax=Phialocephala subalpina TaxID=576137 RepID=A0A1L7X177_9HELO|nr:uncharacterized protein PAC_08670 [Phialocephala subalpina]
MDPLTVLGLASNIVQLVTFTSDLVSRGNEIYKSADGVLIENLELESITTTLQKLASYLVVPDRHSQRPTKTETQLQELCNGCKDVSGRLLNVIQGLKAKEPHAKWNSFHQALNSVWKENDIRALESRLERYRRQIDTTLLVSLRECVQELSDRELDNEQVRNEMLRQVKQSQAELIDCFLKIDWRLQNQQDMAAFSSKLSATTKHERESILELQILESLRFNTMADRFESIVKAHKRTFDWAYLNDEGPNAFDSNHDDEGKDADGTADENPKAFKARHWSNFIDWIHGESSLYWVTGKPGAGKSTLMKFLHNDSRTRQNLTQWSGKFPLVIAGFFFWNAGTTMQTSKLGLLQTLLYDSIKHDSTLVPRLFPQRWKLYQTFGGDLRPWSMTELAQGFDTLISDTSTRFCFFIDGLDEFDGDGTELVSFVYEILSSRTNVKLCVASRPWLVFEDAFKRQPSLRLEELTAPDVHLYVTENLRGNGMFLELEKLRPRDAEHLIDEVTGKASGVFLWVHLVVLSLLEGLRDGDSISDLEYRLSLLPSDLEKLFAKILECLNPFYFRQASWLFQLVRAASQPLTLLHLSLAEEGFDKAMSAEVKPIAEEELLFRAETMRRRLSSRCKGLIEAPAFRSKGSYARIQYLHRTVRDYLTTPSAWHYIVSGTDQSFDPDILLSAASLFYIKVLPQSTTWALAVLEYFWEQFNFCVNHCLQFEESINDVHVSILSELERTGDVIFSCSIGNDGKTLSHHIFTMMKWGAGRELNEDSHWTATETRIRRTPRAFFDYAFRRKLYSYVNYKLSKGLSLDWKIDNYSLVYAATSSKDIPMLKVLFQNGAQVSATDWAFLAIEARSEREEPEELAKLADIVSVFLGSGSDLPSSVGGDSLDIMIRKSFSHWDPVRTQVLLEKMAMVKASQRRKQKGFSRVLGGFLKR